MEPKERIPQLLGLLKERWEDAPAMRFGQLLVNLGIVTDSAHNWNIEDDVVMEMLGGAGSFSNPSPKLTKAIDSAREL